MVYLYIKYKLSKLRYVYLLIKIKLGRAKLIHFQLLYLK